MKKYALAIAALLALGAVQTASAEVSVGISIGVPGVVYPAPGYYYGPPAYYRRPPLIVVPRGMRPPAYGWHGGHARYNSGRSNGKSHWHGKPGHGKHKHKHRGGKR